MAACPTRISFNDECMYANLNYTGGQILVLYSSKLLTRSQLRAAFGPQHVQYSPLALRKYMCALVHDRHHHTPITGKSKAKSYPLVHVSVSQGNARELHVRYFIFKPAEGTEHTREKNPKIFQKQTNNHRNEAIFLIAVLATNRNV